MLNTDAVYDAAQKTTDGDILQLAKGVFQFTKTLVLGKSIELRGAQYQVDARSRSTTGFGKATYSGPYDLNESTLVGNDLLTLIVIKASNVSLKGLTITVKLEYKDKVGTISILRTNN